MPRGGEQHGEEQQQAQQGALSKEGKTLATNGTSKAAKTQAGKTLGKG